MSVVKAQQEPKVQRLHSTTVDGWNIALYRYRPTGGPRVGHPPILLCHGLGANRYNLDAPGDISLARWLVKRGFDCWVLEFRGAGQSTHPSFLHRMRNPWTFDDYVFKDIPAVLDTIENDTGSRQVHWVGHSMGGMVIRTAVIMPSFPVHLVKAIITLGTPHQSAPYLLSRSLVSHYELVNK